MGRNYYSEINLHYVWHTKTSSPLLIPKLESLAHRFITAKIKRTAGAFIHEIGGTATHVHVAVSIPPTILISEFVGKLKGGSSHDVNEEIGSKALEWQTGYGVVNFGTGDLEWVCKYIRNQKEHHAQRTVHERLERIDSDDPVAAEAEAAESRKPRERG